MAMAIATGVTGAMIVTGTGATTGAGITTAVIGAMEGGIIIAIASAAGPNGAMTIIATGTSGCVSADKTQGKT